MAQGHGSCHPGTLVRSCYRKRCTQCSRGLINGEGQNMVGTGGVEKLMLGRGRREDAEKAAVTTTTRASGHAQQRCEGDGAQLFSLRLHVARLSRNYFRFSSQQPHTIYPSRDSSALCCSFGSGSARVTAHSERIQLIVVYRAYPESEL
jgi:hypothetical protein